MSGWSQKSPDLTDHHLEEALGLRSISGGAGSQYLASHMFAATLLCV
jgi:hypothetical protein